MSFKSFIIIINGGRSTQPSRGAARFASQDLNLVTWSRPFEGARREDTECLPSVKNTEAGPQGRFFSPSEIPRIAEYRGCWMPVFFIFFQRVKCTTSPRFFYGVSSRSINFQSNSAELLLHIYNWNPICFFNSFPSFPFMDSFTASGPCLHLLVAAVLELLLLVVRI
jgi:hypothetical protein